MNEKIIAEALEMARMKEQREQCLVEEVYILQDRVYFNKRDLAGNVPDFTLVRHMDETSTAKNYPERAGF